MPDGPPAMLPFGQGTPFPFDSTRVLESFFGPAPAAERAAWQDIEISQEEERRVGDAAVERLLADLRRRNIAVTRGGRDVEYLEKLVELLRPRLRNAKRYPKIRVLVASSEWTDARSIPGGTLVFFRGIIDFAGSEAALVGVVGHELSHLDRGHQLYDRRLVEAAKQRFGNMAERNPAAGNPAAGEPAAGNPATGEPAAGEPAALWADGLALARGFARPLRPEEETEADRDAVAWMVAAGYDPRSLAELFRRWDRRERERGAAPPAVLDFLRSHPPHAARHADVLAEAARINAQPRPAPHRLYVGTRNLRERVTRDERRFPE